MPGLVDAVYVKLFKYDATKRHFVPQQHGYDGALAADVETLSLADDVIQFRKQHLARYLAALVTRPYDAKMVQYLDTVGAMHTPAVGSAAVDVPLVQMNALLGLRGRRNQRHDLQFESRSRNGATNAAGVRQAALAPKRSDQPALCESTGCRGRSSGRMSMSRRSRPKARMDVGPSPHFADD